MIKANVILDSSKWKNKIKNPKNYFKKNFTNYLKFHYLKKKIKSFQYYLLTPKK